MIKIIMKKTSRGAREKPTSSLVRVRDGKKITVNDFLQLQERYKAIKDEPEKGFFLGIADYVKHIAEHPGLDAVTGSIKKVQVKDEKKVALKDKKYKKVKKTSRRYRPKDDWIAIKVPAIIDEGLYNQVQKQLKDNYELTQRNVKNKYLLSGKLYCVCGRKRTGEGPQKGKHLYYRCTDRVHMHPLPRKCFEKGINARVADKLIWDGIARYMTSPKVLKSQVERWMNDRVKETKQTQGSAEELEKELLKIKKEEQRYIKAYGAEMIDSSQLKEATDDLKLQKRSVERQIMAIRTNDRVRSLELPGEDEINRFCDVARDVIGDLKFESKQLIVRKVVDKIVGKQKDLRVYGHLPLNTSVFATLEKGGVKNVKFRTERRDSWVTQRRQKYPV